MICEKCNLCKEATKQCFPSGSDHPLIYIVGEAPGKEEDEAGVPFVGRSGQLLREALRTVGISEDQFRLFNIVRCIPRNNRGVRAPSDEEKSACHEYLYADIVNHQPGVILTLGGSSSSYLLGDKFSTITKTRGILNKDMTISYQWNGNTYSYTTAIIASFHPSYLLRNGRNPELMDKLYHDISLARDYAMGRI